MRRPLGCPKCDSPMEEGFLVDQGHGSASVSRWQPGQPRKSIWTGVKQSKKEQIEVATWKCSRCGYLESYAINA